MDSNRAWSGDHSLDLSIDQTLVPYSDSSTLAFERDPFDVIYASWWTYIEPTAHSTNPQGLGWTGLKYVYITCSDCADGRSLQAATNSVMNVFSFSKRDDHVTAFQFENNTWVDCPGKTNPFAETFDRAFGAAYEMPWSYWRPAITGGATSFDDVERYAPSVGEWTRCELYAYRGSGPDQPDGELMFAVTKPGRGRTVGHHSKGIVLQTGRSDCRSAPSPWSRFVFFHFFDDPSIGDRAEKCEISVDDVYLQFGTLARVEIGDHPDYAKCTRLEVQLPIRWDDASVFIQMNAGGFITGDQVYLFVVRGDGAITAGYPFTIP